MRKLFTRPGPRKTQELERILALPERDAEETGASIAEALSALFRTPKGEQTLRPLQALALAEAYDFGGAVVLLPVGQGKTLVSYLLPSVLDAKRPLLIVPAKLLEKTRIEFATLEEHWRKPENLTIASYEMISTDPDFLERINPDLIIADEAHKLKNKKAACTKRVWRYFTKNEPVFVPMSGTLAKRSFFDWWHLQLMALPEGLHVLPMDWMDCELWAKALDEKTTDRAGLGALEVFGKTLQSAREGFGRRLKATPGVIAADSVDVGASIQIDIASHYSTPVTDALAQLREDWTLPDGTEFSEAVDFWRHARELANGFYYRWVEEPPEYWREARRACNGFVRDVLRGSRTYSAPSEVVEAFSSAPEVSTWLAIRDSFKPETEAVWISYRPVKTAIEAAKVAGGLIWYEHTAIAEKLSENVPTFGSQGANIKTGESLVKFDGPIAAVSITACSEGFNLQKFSKNFILNCTPTGDRWEQLLGRTHRSGQESDTVEATLVEFDVCQRNDLRQAKADAAYIEATTGQRQKLMLADYVCDIESERLM
jgi:hypothetical protein